MTEGKDLRRCFGSGIPRELTQQWGGRAEAQGRRPQGGGDLAARALARAAVKGEDWVAAMWWCRFAPRRLKSAADMERALHHDTHFENLRDRSCYQPLAAPPCDA